jgi:hemoglobin
MTDEPSAYERLGGEEKLRAIVGDFVDRVMRDMMIGFFFRQVDKQRLTELELQFASGHLGGPSRYQGRPLRAAHGPHPVMGGHFNRRLRLLDQTLRDHSVPDDIRTAWLSHNESLRSHITKDALGECNDPLASRAAESSKTGGES